MCLADIVVGRRQRRSSPRRARSCARQLDRLAERGWTRQRRHRARVHRLRRHLRGGVGRRLPRPDAGQPLQRRLLAAGHRARRAADAPHPQRDDGRGHARRGLQGRVQPRPARDQLPLRHGAARPPTSTSSTRTAPRRWPPRTARRSRSWRSTTSARATRATSTSRCAAPTARRSSPTTSSCFDRFLGGHARRAARADAVPRAERQLLQALRGAAPSPRRRSPGATTTAPARCASSATARASASSAACRAPTSTRTWRSAR